MPLIPSTPAPTHPPTLGLVLAGGLARRMGGGDKALITIGGTAILDRVIARLRPATTAIILNANGDPARFARWHLPSRADFWPRPLHVLRVVFGILEPGEPLAKLQWCDEFSTGMSGKRGVRGVLG